MKENALPPESLKFDDFICKYILLVLLHAFLVFPDTLLAPSHKAK